MIRRVVKVVIGLGLGAFGGWIIGLAWIPGIAAALVFAVLFTVGIILVSDALTRKEAIK